MAGERDQNRDLTLPPDTFMYMQNVGKGGLISVFRGPTVVNQTGQDQPVKFDPSTRTYKPTGLEQAVQQCQRANEGDYVVLENPTEDGQFPAGATQQGRELKKGRRVIIPGPWSEALWPGQIATVIEGHRLRSNQYLVAMVYNADEAQKNWDTGTVVKVQSDEGTGAGNEGENKEKKAKGLPKPESFAVGTRIVIRGSDVSFYIPCTGVEVLRDDQQRYVREAVTLEQMEYACLIDENGKKEYPHGPAVVFPRPTQVFDEDSKKRRKFKPIELNTINGIHLKVTAPFEGPDIENDPAQTRKFKEGEELFVTGKTLSIYYPREELAIIEYGQGNRKHFSTVIAKGEGRYVINRTTGVIRLLRGPHMFLADPRIDIPVRRVLSTDECALWYPGNTEAVTYNLDLAAAMAESPSGRSGMVSEGDYRKRQAKSLRNFGGASPAASYLASSAGLEAADFSPEAVGDEGGSAGSITRGTKYTEPRTITLNTKYDGVPRIEVWPGYAVLVVGAEGQRKVVQGPEVILLEYDQKLGFMELSTGKPKTTDKLYRTSYLQTHNNQVGDIVPFESKDHVKGTVKISLRVNFEAASEEDKLKWFSVSNYVKYLTDHVRSVLAGMAKRHTVAEIKADYINLVREAILGAKAADGQSESLRTTRPGMSFEENGMRVVEVEVLDMGLADANIAKLLDQAQHKVVATNIEIDAARKDLEAVREKEGIEQAKAQIKDDTSKMLRRLEREAAEDQINLIVAQIEVELKKIDGSKQKKEAEEGILDLVESKKLARAKQETEHLLNVDKERLALKKDEIVATTDAAVKRLAAAKDGLSEALVALGRDDLAAKLAEACNLERHLTGDSLGSSVGNILSFFPTLSAFMERGQGAAEKLSGNRLKDKPALPSKA